MTDPNGETALGQAAQGIVEEWLGEQGLAPEVLYHYTSADGAIGILTSKSMWVTDLRYMNDLSELQYASKLISARIAARMELGSLTEIQAEFLRRSSGTFNPFEPGGSVFAACFCEEGNLLSQWRAYRGAGGGYAIGIDFFHVLRLLDRPCVLRKVIYDTEQQRSHVDRAIEKFLEVIAEGTAAPTDESAEETLLATACSTFGRVMGEFLFSFKHPAFSEEKEWRLVHFASTDRLVARSATGAKFRSFGGNIVPYFELSLERAIKASLDDTLGIGFPIIDVVVGPTVNPDLNLESTRALLLALNPDLEPRVRHSGIPLRWL